MQIQDILQNVTDRNAPVLGCIARSGDKMFHNLDDFGLDCTKIADSVDELFHLTSMLDDEDANPLNIVFAEFDGHSLLGQRVDDSLMIAVADHLQRGAYKKLQVGLSMQARMMVKALADAPTPEPVAAPEPTPEPEAPAKDEAELVATPDNPKKAEPAKGGLGALRALGSVFGSSGPETSSQSDGSDDPANAGKRKRVYRGQVYWE